MVEFLLKYNSYVDSIDLVIFVKIFNNLYKLGHTPLFYAFRTGNI